ncbi:MAG TPA: hypothetical protein VFV96_02090 [Verrucomicrobiae bacterium]|nr:hypothetical protein [Verrucomicrobiae bacterium]
MRRGTKTTITGGLLFLLGAFVVPLWLVLVVVLHHKPETQFKVPGQTEVTVKEAGRYYLWHDCGTVYPGRNYAQSADLPDGLTIQVHAASGRELPFVSDRSISASNNGSTKKSIGYVDVAQPETVTVQVSGSAQDLIFSFSQFRLLRLFGLIFGGVGLSILVGLGGLGLMVWGIVKLVRAKPHG